jgi:glycosyltransferase involved in cell wall biosynthesis
MQQPKIRVLAINGNHEIHRRLGRSDEIEYLVMAEPAVADAVAQFLPANQILPYAPGAKINLHAVRQVRATIRFIRPDIVQTFSSRPLAHALLATAWLPRPPKIVAYRGVTRQLSRFDPSNWVTYFHQRLSATVCASNAVRHAMIASGVPADRCMTIYDGQTVVQSPPNVRSLLSQWRVPEEAFVVGTVGTIRPVKRADLILRAALACLDLEDVCWVLIGSIRDRHVSRLLKSPSLKGRVFSLGYQQQASMLAAAFDVFVMTSRMEGLCRALLESMSHGVCPVVTDVGGMPEVVRNGIDGLVIRPGNVEELVGAIRRLHADRSLLRQYGASALNRIGAAFSHERSCEELLHLYQRLVA